MKITNLISMLAAASAVGFCMSATAGEGKSGTLVLADPVTNVSVTASAPDTPIGGSWDNPAPDIVDGYFEIDCDAATSNQFTATSITDSKVVKCEFVLMPSPVPYTGSLPAPDSDAQVAFCIATNTTSGGASTLQAYVGNSWKTLTGTVPTKEYTLTITLDYSGDTKYAKFAIGGTTLTYNSEEWIATGKNDATGIKDYCFVGSGSLKSILTTGQNIAAEAVPAVVIGGDSVVVDVPEAQVSAVKAAATTQGSTVAAVLASVANTVVAGAPNNMTVAEAIALGLVEADGSTLKANDSVIKMQPNALEQNEGFTMGVNVAKPKGSNATITYTLLGSTDGSTFTPVTGYVDKPAQPVVPTSLIGTESGKYLFFKVKVSVSYPANN